MRNPSGFQSQTGSIIGALYNCISFRIVVFQSQTGSIIGSSTIANKMRYLYVSIPNWFNYRKGQKEYSGATPKKFQSQTGSIIGARDEKDKEG